MARSGICVLSMLLLFAVSSNALNYEVQMKLFRLNPTPNPGLFEASFSLSMRWLPNLADTEAPAVDQVPCTSLTDRPNLHFPNESPAAVSSKRWSWCQRLTAGIVVEHFRVNSMFQAENDLSRFPADTQTFNILVETMDSAKVVTMSLSNVEGFALDSSSDHLFPPPGWRLDTMTAESKIVDYAAEGSRFQRLVFIVGLQRSVSFVVSSILLPGAVLVCMAWASLFLGIDDSKARLLATLLPTLSLLALRTAVHLTTPVVNYGTAMDGIFLGAVLVCALSFAFNMFVLNLVSHGRTPLALRINFLGKVSMPILTCIVLLLALIALDQPWGITLVIFLVLLLVFGILSAWHARAFYLSITAPIDPHESMMSHMSQHGPPQATMYEDPMAAHDVAVSAGSPIPLRTVKAQSPNQSRYLDKPTDWITAAATGSRFDDSRYELPRYESGPPSYEEPVVRRHDGDTGGAMSRGRPVSQQDFARPVRSVQEHEGPRSVVVPRGTRVLYEEDDRSVVGEGVYASNSRAATPKHPLTYSTRFGPRPLK